MQILVVAFLGVTKTPSHWCPSFGAQLVAHLPSLSAFGLGSTELLHIPHKPHFRSLSYACSVPRLDGIYHFCLLFAFDPRFAIPQPWPRFAWMTKQYHSPVLFCNHVHVLLPTVRAMYEPSVVMIPNSLPYGGLVQPDYLIVQSPHSVSAQPNQAPGWNGYVNPRSLRLDMEEQARVVSITS